MIAPPQVQAQSFAKAILTDITSILPGRPGDGEAVRADLHQPVGSRRADANDVFKRKRVNPLEALKRRDSGGSDRFRPITEQAPNGCERPRRFEAPPIGRAADRFAVPADRFADPGGTGSKATRAGRVKKRIVSGFE
jgi:hypothetical protein